MAMKVVTLNEASARELKDLAAEVRRLLRSASGRAAVDIEDGGQAPELFVARAPSPGGIPPMVDTTPGHTNCKVYQAVYPAPDSDDIELVEIGDDTRPVYSLLQDEVPADTWVLVQRDKTGTWWTTHSASLASKGDASCRYLHAEHLLDDLEVTGTGDLPSTDDAVEVLSTDIMLDSTYELAITAMLVYDGADGAGTGVNYQLLLNIDDFFEGTAADFQTVFADQKGTIFYQWYKGTLLAGTHTIKLYVAADDAASTITAKVGTKLIISGTAADCGKGGVNACLEVVVGVICDPTTKEPVFETKTIHFRGYVDDAGCP